MIICQAPTQRPIAGFLVLVKSPDNMGEKSALDDTITLPHARTQPRHANRELQHSSYNIWVMHELVEINIF